MQLKSRLGRTLARAAIRVGAPRVRRVRLLARPPTEPREDPLFEIYTFVTDDALYETMRSSFAEAGFISPLAKFGRLTDGRDGGPALDPYAAITRIGAEPGSRYAILCHQDIRLDRGAGSNELVAELEGLDELDPRWVVAGNAGVTRTLRLVRRLVDPYGGSTPDPVPVQVVSLDENFLVLNRRRVARCTPGLHGFHFYGADVCLNAMADGGTAYVIDFLVTHLSRGGADADYRAAKQQLAEAWNRRSFFLYVGTTTTIVFSSRSRTVRKLFGSGRALRLVSSVAPPRVLESKATAARGRS